MPRLDDFFPHMRRGHGTTHPAPRINKQGVQTRNATVCVASGCRGYADDKHTDKGANVADWKEERGFGKATPLEACR
jgi:hypothetical protein